MLDVVLGSTSNGSFWRGSQLAICVESSTLPKRKILQNCKTGSWRFVDWHSRGDGNHCAGMMKITITPFPSTHINN